jgi:hypothetical protein
MDDHLNMGAITRYKHLIYQLYRYSDKYEISIQLWPEQYTVYIAKDGIDLESFGSDGVIDTLERALNYLRQINKNG